MKYGTLFSGIEGFGQGFDRSGMECAFQCEIDPQALDVLRYHYPDVPKWNDVTEVDPDELPSVDVICGGFPCQDVSVAGQRAGLAGERSGLWFEFLRIVEGVRPDWVVIENVPGLISSHGGDDLRAVLDGLENAGYVIEMDILNTQHFGPPQRRRRVFVVCELASRILEKKTITSALTIAQCLIESLALTLAEARGRYLIDSGSSDFDASDPGRSLQRRMRLFGLDTASDPVSMLRASLTALQPLSAPEPSVSGSVVGSPASRISEATRSHGSIELTETGLDEYQSIERSWSAISDALSRAKNGSTTSTDGRETTEQQIYSCAQATLYIAERIIRSPSSSPTFWSAASSASTALRAFTDYARSTGSDLFADVEWVHSWRDFLAEADVLSNSVGGFGADGAGEILPLPEGVPWNPPPSREAREGASGGTEAGAGGSGGVAFPLTAREGKGPASSVDSRNVVAHTLRGEGFDASEDGTGRGTPLVLAFQPKASVTQSMGLTAECPTLGTTKTPAVIPFDTTQITSKANRTRAVPGRECHTLPASGDPPSIAYAAPVAPTLGKESHSSMKCSSGQMADFTVARAVPRRLTPRECERLQGFLDDWTKYGRTPDGETFELKDSPRYRCLGNAVSVPVAEWIARRIMEAA